MSGTVHGTESWARRARCCARRYYVRASQGCRHLGKVVQVKQHSSTAAQACWLDSPAHGCDTIPALEAHHAVMLFGTLMPLAPAHPPPPGLLTVPPAAPPATTATGAAANRGPCQEGFRRAGHSWDGCHSSHLPIRQAPLYALPTDTAPTTPAFAIAAHGPELLAPSDTR